MAAESTKPERDVMSQRFCRIVRLTLTAVVALALVTTPPAQATDNSADQEEDATNLAKQTQNPVANLISVPFHINYNISNGWYLTSAPIITADFSASGDNHWTVPVGGGGGKLWRLGNVGLPLNTQLQTFYNADTPEFGPDWQLRAQLQFLFPR